MSGLELFNKEDISLMPDLLHPNSDGYRLMGERFAAIQRGFLNKVLS
jgi:lysophospholipase L1-like esterase